MKNQNQNLDLNKEDLRNTLRLTIPKGAINLDLNIFCRDITFKP